MQHLKTLSDSDLLNQTRLLVARERELTTELLWHLKEVERRRLYAEQGYSSLFDYVRRGLGYCEGSADRRISAMRLLKELPEIEPALKSGDLSLSNASALEHFFKNEQKHRQKPYSQAQKKELLGKVTGKSRRECDQLLAALAPEMPKPEQSRPISATQTEIRFTAQQELLAKFEKLKGLLSHRNPNPSYAELFEMLADLALKRLDPEQKQGRKKEACKEEEKPVSATPPAESTKPHRATSLASEERLASREPSLYSPTAYSQALRPVSSQNQASQPSRYIPQALRRAVWKRDQGQCTYVNQKTGVRCSSKHLLEIHHILDFSLGGGHTLDNLALRCQCHNLHAAARTHGAPLMNRYLRG